MDGAGRNRYRGRLQEWEHAVALNLEVEVPAAVVETRDGLDAVDYAERLPVLLVSTEKYK